MYFSSRGTGPSSLTLIPPAVISVLSEVAVELYIGDNYCGIECLLCMKKKPLDSAKHIM